MNAPSQTPNNNADVTNKVRELLAYMEHDAHASNVCLDQGVITETAATIGVMFSDPVKFLFTSYSSANTELKKYVNGIVNRFLNYNREEIYKAAKKPDSLTYYIAFKNDTYELRDQFYRFLDHYEGIDFSADFTIYFRFVGRAVADKFESNTIVELENGETSTTGAA